MTSLDRFNKCAVLYDDMMPTSHLHTFVKNHILDYMETYSDFVGDRQHFSFEDLIPFTEFTKFFSFPEEVRIFETAEHFLSLTQREFRIYQLRPNNEVN